MSNSNVWDCRGTTAPAAKPEEALHARLFVVAPTMEDAQEKCRQWSNRRHGGQGCFSFSLVKETGYRGKSVLGVIPK